MSQQPKSAPSFGHHADPTLDFVSEVGRLAQVWETDPTGDDLARFEREVRTAWEASASAPKNEIADGARAILDELRAAFPGWEYGMSPPEVAYPSVAPTPDPLTALETGDEDRLAVALCVANGHDPRELTYHAVEPGVPEPCREAWAHYLPQARALIAMAERAKAEDLVGLEKFLLGGGRTGEADEVPDRPAET